MTANGALIVLDTNVLVHLARQDAIGGTIDKDHGLTSRPERPLISIVTVGEIRSLAEQWHWGERKRHILNSVLSQLVVVRLAQGEITLRYAELDFHNRKVAKPARPIGENDTWIAATAMATGGTLITTDSDFDHLAPHFFGLVRVDSKTGSTILTRP